MAEKEQKPASPEMREVATTRDGRDITRGYVDGLGILPNRDSVLQIRGGGDLRVYEQVLQDDEVKGALTQRIRDVTSREWQVDAGGEDPADEEAAEFMRELLDHLAWDKITEKMLYGVFYGYSVAECIWTIKDNRVWCEDVKVRNRRRFGFDIDGQPRLITFDDPQGEVLPERKFWTFSCGADNDDEPYGLGLGYWLYWPTFFKRNNQKFWLIYNDKFGMPTAKGTYPPNATTEEKSRLLEALRAIHTDSGIAIPEGMVVELLEAARSGTADYASLHDKMNAAIDKIIVTQTMSSNDGSSLAQAEVHERKGESVAESDADLIDSSWSRGPGAWLTAWNFPKAKPPIVSRVFDEEEDLNTTSERDERLTRMGFEPSEEYIREKYGDGWVKKKPQNPPPGLGDRERIDVRTLGEDNPEFAEPEDNTPPEKIATKLEDVLGAIFDGLLDRVREEITAGVESGLSFAEIQDRLLEVYSELEIDPIAGQMQRALAAADLVGRYKVNEGE